MTGIITYTCPDCSHTTDVLPGVVGCAGCGKAMPMVAVDTRPPAWAVDYFQDCRTLLGVGDDWNLWLSFVEEPGAEADPDAALEADGWCGLEARYLKANIHVRRGLSEQRTREVIMHELLHVVLHPLSLAADRVRDLLPQRLWVHAAMLFSDAEEQTIERMTRALQRGIKPPPMPPDVPAEHADAAPIPAER